MKSRLAGLWLAAAALALLACGAAAEQEQGPYEDIQALLHSAAAASGDLAALDARGPPRVVEVHHDHHHVVPHDMPAHVAEHIAEINTPIPPPARVVPMKNRVKAARHAREDAAYRAADRIPAVHTVDIQHSVRVRGPRPTHLEYTVKGQRGDTKEDGVWKLKGSGYHFPLVDRGLQRPTFSIIADTDGSDKADPGNPRFKAHTAADLQAEAVRLLARAKKLQAKKNAEAKGKTGGDENLGVFDSNDAGYEDELTRLKRVSARMNRLREQIETPRPNDSFEGSIARHRYYLKLYRQLKRDATDIIEAYAMRTGHSIFELFGDGKVDPSIAAFLPPNSVAAILAQYANPTRGRSDETPRDVISGREAKRIRYSIDYYRAKKHGRKPPLPPVYALSDDEEAALRKHNNPLFNKVVATGEGKFGQGRPSVTMGKQAIGRSSLHISVVNPAETQHDRGLPYQVNLKKRAQADKGGKVY